MIKTEIMIFVKAVFIHFRFGSNVIIKWYAAKVKPPH